MKMAREDYPIIKITRSLRRKQYCYLRCPLMSVVTLLGAQHYNASTVFFSHNKITLNWHRISYNEKETNKN